MADYFLLASSEVYVLKPTDKTAAMTKGGLDGKKRNMKSRNSTSKKIKSSNYDDSELKNSKPKPKPKPKPKLKPKPNPKPRLDPTSCPALSPENDFAVSPVPLYAPTTTTPSANTKEEEHTVEGLLPSTTKTTSNAAAAAATIEIPFYVPLRFEAAPPPLPLIR